METDNIYRAEEWLSNARIDDVFTVEFYRTLHTRMFEDVWDWAGKLRTDTGNQVGHPFVRAELVAAELGRVAMEFYNEWQEYEDGDADILPFLARYHHALVLVHPFNQQPQGGQFYLAELGAKGVSFMLPLTTDYLGQLNGGI